jgi:hypothetical protein
VLSAVCCRYKLYWTRAGQETYIVDRIVFNKIKALLGGRMRFAITGGAPLSPETHDFIRVCLGITLVQEPFLFLQIISSDEAKFVPMTHSVPVGSIPTYNLQQCYGSGSVGSACFWVSWIRIH